MTKAKVEFAVDGIHYQPMKTGTTEKMYNYFIQNPEIRQHLAVNPQAKFRLTGETGLVIGILGYDPKRGEFTHSGETKLKEVI